MMLAEIAVRDAGAPAAKISAAVIAMLSTAMQPA